MKNLLLKTYFIGFLLLAVLSGLFIAIPVYLGQAELTDNSIGFLIVLFVVTSLLTAIIRNERKESKTDLHDYSAE